MKDFIPKTCLVILMCTIFYGCPEKAPDYSYEVLIENGTNDTISFVYGTDNSPIDLLLKDKHICLPKTILRGSQNGFYSFEFNGDFDPVSYFFSQFIHPLDTFLVFRHDTLKVRWVYPAYSGPSNVHSFFNFNSWESWLDYEKHGNIKFTIYPSDLTLNKK